MKEEIEVKGEVEEEVEAPEESWGSQVEEILDMFLAKHYSGISSFVEVRFRWNLTQEPEARLIRRGKKVVVFVSLLPSADLVEFIKRTAENVVRLIKESRRIVWKLDDVHHALVLVEFDGETEVDSSGWYGTEEVAFLKNGEFGYFVSAFGNHVLEAEKVYKFKL